VLAELAAVPVALRRAEHTSAEPTGLPALRELAAALYGGDDPVGPTEGTPPPPLLQVRRTAGSGTSPDSAFELVLPLPGVAQAHVDLTRIDDELAVTASGTRRVVALPSVLRRCTATGAHVDGDALRVAFVPDPAVWLR
jgi:arsenite/tail-anchored protein-transporting ATPase